MVIAKEGVGAGGFSHPLIGRVHMFVWLGTQDLGIYSTPRRWLGIGCEGS